jgi:hypothetical protein
MLSADLYFLVSSFLFWDMKIKKFTISLATTKTELFAMASELPLLVWRT